MIQQQKNLLVLQQEKEKLDQEHDTSEDQNLNQNLMTKNEFDDFLKDMLFGGEDTQELQENMQNMQTQQINKQNGLQIIKLTPKQIEQIQQRTVQIDSNEANKGARQSGGAVQSNQQNSSGQVDYVRLGDNELKAKPQYFDAHQS